MNFRSIHSSVLLGIFVCLLDVTTAQAIILGQIDNFNDNTVQDWQRGVVALGGPGGAADPFLQLESNGTPVAGGKLVTFNQAQWSGDYTAAGVGNISTFLNNNGDNDLFVRIAIGDSMSPMQGGTWFASTDAIQLAPGSGWIPATFSLAESDLAKIQGPLGYGGLMTNVMTLRILHATGPSATGGIIPGMLGVDNIQALPVPEPGGMAMVMVAMAAVMALRTQSNTRTAC